MRASSMLKGFAVRFGGAVAGLAPRRVTLAVAASSDAPNVRPDAPRRMRATPPWGVHGEAKRTHAHYELYSDTGKCAEAQYSCSGGLES